MWYYKYTIFIVVKEMNMMFLSTSGLNQSYILKGIVNATVKRTLKAEELDEVDQFDNLYAQVQKKLENKALN